MTAWRGRRLRVAAAAAGLVAGVLLLFFFPAEVPRHFGHLTFTRVDFMPIWRWEGRAFSELWLFLELFVALAAGAFVWFVYPDYHPPPPPD